MTIGVWFDADVSPFPAIRTSAMMRSTYDDEFSRPPAVGAPASRL